jgi:hypothetical protein
MTPAIWLEVAGSALGACPLASRSFVCGVKPSQEEEKR